MVVITQKVYSIKHGKIWEANLLTYGGSAASQDNGRRQKSVYLFEQDALAFVLSWGDLLPNPTWSPSDEGVATHVGTNLERHPAGMWLAQPP